MSVEFGMYVNPGANGEASFDVHCMLYNTIRPKESPVNSGLLGGFIIEVRDLPSEQAYTTGPIDLRGALPDGIRIPDDSFFVDIAFYEPGSTTVLSERATPVFCGAGTGIGHSTDVYWSDTNGNGRYDPQEAANFGGTPYGANFYLVLDGVVDTGCMADFNGDGTVDSQDFFGFLQAFFDEKAAADFNQDAVVNSQDLFEFLTAFFSGCP
jgi:hypothetical protein